MILMPASIPRIQTGVKGLDELLGGGFVEGSINLVSGAPGTGKSIFCLQVLYSNALRGKRCLYISFEQNIKDIELQMKKFNWSPIKVKENLELISLNASESSVSEKISSKLSEKRFDLIAIDSLASLVAAPVSPEEISKYSLEKIASSVFPVPLQEESITRIKVKAIVDAVRKSNATALLTTEISKESEWFSRDMVSEFLCDSVIEAVSENTHAFIA